MDAPLDVYFQKARAFIGIAVETWPLRLAELGAMDAAHRRNALLLGEAERFARHPPAHPVIAAGSTGTVPATAALLKAIAGLPQGAVVLPGLDIAMEEADWSLIADAETAPGQPGHPQGALKRLLGRMGVARADCRHAGRAFSCACGTRLRRGRRAASRGCDGRLARPPLGARTVA